MKKVVMVFGVWIALLLTMVQVNCKTTITYTLYCDSNSTQSYEVKEDIQDVYAKLVSGVHSQSYIFMVYDNLEQFEVRKNMKVSIEKNELKLVEGDGKGSIIHGDLIANSICVPKVEPRSLILEWFQKT